MVIKSVPRPDAPLVRIKVASASLADSTVVGKMPFTMHLQSLCHLVVRQLFIVQEIFRRPWVVRALLEDFSFFEVRVFWQPIKWFMLY